MITGNDIKLLRAECIYTDPVTGARSMLYKVSVSRGMSYADLTKLHKKGSARAVVLRRSKFFKSINRDFIVFAYSDEVPPQKWEETTPLHLIRPATGQAANVWSFSDITDKYREVESNAAELWTRAEKQSRMFCVHGPGCKRPNCEAGKSIQTIHIVTGQFVVLWGFLQECVPRGKKLRLVQVAVKRARARGAEGEEARDGVESANGEEKVVGGNEEEKVMGGNAEEKMVDSNEEEKLVDAKEEEKVVDAKEEQAVDSNAEKSLHANEEKSLHANAEKSLHAETTCAKTEETQSKSAVESDSERTVDSEEIIGISDSEEIIGISDSEQTKPEGEAKEEELLITGVRILGAKSEELKAKLREMQEIQEREGRSSSLDDT